MKDKSCNSFQKITIQKLVFADEIKYVDKIPNRNGDPMPEIAHRIRPRKNEFRKINNYNVEQVAYMSEKGSAFYLYVLPAVAYGSETWTLTTKMIQTLQITQGENILGLIWMGRKRIK